MSPGATFERVYLALKERLGAARYAAGAHLEPAVLSHELNASITPVRDALHRLVGEGLVEAPRGDGFRTPLLTEVGLRHLYRWNGAMLNLAARSPHAGCPPEPDTGRDADAIETTERLFLAIAAWPGNPEHVAAIARLNDRFRPIRRIETELMNGIEDEVAAIGRLTYDGASSGLRRAIAAFHRRREKAVGEIVAFIVETR